MTDAPLPSAGELEPDKNQPDLDQFKSVEREMTGFERATLRWAKIAVLLSGLAALFICGQWYEMHTGGQDTRILAEAAKKQADKAETISASLERAVVAMQDANEQGRASLQSAIVNSHVDQRAWLSVGFSSPTGNFAVGKVFDTRITLKNQGKLQLSTCERLRSVSHSTLKMEPAGIRASVTIRKTLFLPEISFLGSKIMLTSSRWLPKPTSRCSTTRSSEFITTAELNTTTYLALIIGKIFASFS